MSHCTGFKTPDTDAHARHEPVPVQFGGGACGVKHDTLQQAAQQVRSLSHLRMAFDLAQGTGNLGGLVAALLSPILLQQAPDKACRAEQNRSQLVAELQLQAGRNQVCG